MDLTYSREAYWPVYTFIQTIPRQMVVIERRPSTCLLCLCMVGFGGVNSSTPLPSPADSGRSRDRLGPVPHPQDPSLVSLISKWMVWPQDTRAIFDPTTIMKRSVGCTPALVLLNDNSRSAPETDRPPGRLPERDHGHEPSQRQPVRSLDTAMERRAHIFETAEHRLEYSTETQPKSRVLSQSLEEDHDASML